MTTIETNGGELGAAAAVKAIILQLHMSQWNYRMTYCPAYFMRQESSVLQLCRLDDILKFHLKLVY